MKKVFMTLCAVLALAGMTACGNANSSDVNNGADSTVVASDSASVDSVAVDSVAVDSIAVDSLK